MRRPETQHSHSSYERHAHETAQDSAFGETCAEQFALFRWSDSHTVWYSLSRLCGMALLFGTPSVAHFHRLLRRMITSKISSFSFLHELNSSSKSRIDCRQHSDCPRRAMQHATRHAK